MSDTRQPPATNTAAYYGLTTPSGRPSTARIQVLSCRCIVRTYDGKVVLVNSTCKLHRVHSDFWAAR